MGNRIRNQLEGIVHDPAMMKLCSFMIACLLSWVMQSELVTSLESLPRIALIITLAGHSKLAQYFEWSCRSIENSKSIADMLIFHENNQRLLNVSCASNVKIINLGDRGLSQSIANILLGTNSSSESARNELILIINNILVHMPQYLNEIKPMYGSLFQSYLTSYAYWTYTDPDIIWGNLADWIDWQDLEKYDLYSISHNFDAGRLFLRQQFTLHVNSDYYHNLAATSIQRPVLHHIWRELSYFQLHLYLPRLSTIYHLLIEHHVPSDEIFKSYCDSSEGWYSLFLMKNTASLSLKIKIIGHAFDDFFREPVIFYQGSLQRCPPSLHHNLTECIQAITTASTTAAAAVTASVPASALVSVSNNNSSSNTQSIEATTTITEARSYRDLPVPQFVPLEAYQDSKHCKMAWLPIETRQCIGKPSYDKDQALGQQEQSSIRLVRVNEVIHLPSSSSSFHKKGKWEDKENKNLALTDWYGNDEETAPRAVHATAAFFHFRHWDDYIASSVATMWPASKVGSDGHQPPQEKCMILFLRYDRALTYADCQRIMQAERQLAEEYQLPSILLTNHQMKSQLIHGQRIEGINNILAAYRKENEGGGVASSNSRDSSNSNGNSNNEGGSLEERKKRKKQMLRKHQNNLRKKKEGVSS